MESFLLKMREYHGAMAVREGCRDDDDAGWKRADERVQDALQVLFSSHPNNSDEWLQVLTLFEINVLDDLGRGHADLRELKWFNFIKLAVMEMAEERSVQRMAS